MITLRIFLGILLIVPSAFASTTDGTIDSTNRYAWSENAGWIDFGTSGGNVHVTDSALSGYAWGENIGWISLNCSNASSCGTVDYKVTNNSEGTLGGNGWSENAGWIQFAPTNGGVTINSSGIFSGYAWGENVGWIVFNCANQSSCSTVDYKVSTDWRPSSARSTSSQSPGVTGGGGGGRRNTSQQIERAAQSIAEPSSTSVPSEPPNTQQENPATLPGFTDIPAKSWFTDAVVSLIREGVLSGYKNIQGQPLRLFGPADPVTVGQIIKMALLSSGNDLPSALPLPKNSTATDWSASYIAFAESLGIDLASENVTRNATRGEVVHALLQSFDIPVASSSDPFSDLPADHPYRIDLLAAHALGLVTGDDHASTVRPDDPISRAEAAVLVGRVMQFVGKI